MADDDGGDKMGALWAPEPPSHPANGRAELRFNKFVNRFVNFSIKF